MDQTVPHPGFRSLLDNRPFGLLWAAQAVSTLGDLLYDIALLWYVLDTTGSALAAGVISVSSGIGFLLGSGSAGLLLDRVPARRIMLGADLARLALTLAVCATWLAGFSPPLAVLYALTFAVSFATAYFNPARAAAMPQVVPREHLLRANALDAVSHGVARTIALPLSGALVAAVGPAPALLADAGTFLLSSLLVYRARWAPEAIGDREQATTLSAALGGLRWARADPLVRTLLVAETVHALAAGVFVSALAPFVRELGGVRPSMARRGAASARGCCWPRWRWGTGPRTGSGGCMRAASCSTPSPTPCSASRRPWGGPCPRSSSRG